MYRLIWNNVSPVHKIPRVMTNAKHKMGEEHAVRKLLSCIMWEQHKQYLLTVPPLILLQPKESASKIWNGTS